MRININKLARIISTIFVPPSFTLITFIFLALYLETEKSKIAITILIALIFGFILPIILFLRYRKRGLIVDADASIKEERTVPMSISVLFFIAGLVLMIIFNLNLISIAFCFCYISNTLIAVLINNNWKISVHTMGASGPLAAIIFVLGSAGLSFLPLVLSVGWSRIQLKCHTISQVVIGGLFAFISTYFQIYLIVNIFG